MHDSISSLLTAGAALIAVLAVILLSGRVARRFAAIPRLGRRTPGTRLAITETIALDQRRRLHLISCDGAEFLLLTGGTTDVVIGRPGAGAPGAGEAP